MTLRAAMRAVARDDRGLSLPEVIVGVLISAATLGVITMAVVSLASLQTATVGSASATVAAQTLESRWRESTENATAVAAVDSHNVAFTSRSDGCIKRTWAATTSAIDMRTESYAADDCTGPVLSTSEERVADGVGATQFVFKNRAGREILFNAGTPQGAGGAKPDAIPQADWDAMTVAAASIRTTVLDSTEWRQPVSVSQVIAPEQPRPATELQSHLVEPGPRPLLDGVAP